ncbi:MAG: hypothetical protein MJ168_07945 [Clostridia bacterium]|nr:hypothetical protein [Clostridia bacterium]
MKNYTVKEAINAIIANDAEAIKDIAKYFPQFLIIVVRGDWDAFANALPDALTLRKLSFDATATAPVEDAEEAVTMPAPMEEAEDEPDDEAEAVDLSTLPVKTLIKMCEDAGYKVARFGKPKTYYIDILNGDAEPEQTFEGKEDKRVTERKAAKKEAAKTAKKNAATGNYAEMKASELFALCQERGIEAATKQKAAYYIKKLEAYDAENGADEEVEEVKPTPKKTAAKAAPKAAPKKAPKKVESVEDEADDVDDWDEEEEVEEETPKKAPKKAAAPAKKAAPKKPAKKVVEEEEKEEEEEEEPEADDDDDWDI